MSDCTNGGRARYLDEFETEVHADKLLYKPRRPRWTPTSITFDTDADTSALREVYVGGVRFVRAPDRDWDSEVAR